MKLTLYGSINTENQEKPSLRSGRAPAVAANGRRPEMMSAFARF
jgi:hypothetical protein